MLNKIIFKFQNYIYSNSPKPLWVQLYLWLYTEIYMFLCGPDILSKVWYYTKIDIRTEWIVHQEVKEKEYV